MYVIFFFFLSPSRSLSSLLTSQTLLHGRVLNGSTTIPVEKQNLRRELVYGWPVSPGHVP